MFTNPLAILLAFGVEMMKGKGREDRVRIDLLELLGPYAEDNMPAVVLG